MNVSSCGRQLECLLAVNAGGVVADSLIQLDASGLVFSAQIMASSTDGGTLKIMVVADKCNPSSEPQISTLEYDWHNPQATLTLVTAPTLYNSSFTVLATFLKPVLPFRPANVAATGATVKR